MAIFVDGDTVVRRWEAGGMRIVGRAALAVALLLVLLAAPMALAGSHPVADPSPGSGPGASQAGLPEVASLVPTPVPSATAEPRIIGGSQASTLKYPWMVALTRAASGSAYCGGMLVAPDRVLTAAHCISGYAPGSVRVIAGRTDLRSDDGEERSVRHAWIHPAYRSPTEGADVAVLALDRALPYSSLSLETDQGTYRPGLSATVMGWGFTSESGPTSPVLRSAVVPLVAEPDCAAIYREFNPQEMVCAADPRGAADACYGDSGGPLVANGRLIGIISWGSGCARQQTPGVYVRVASYAADIHAQLHGVTLLGKSVGPA